MSDTAATAATTVSVADVMARPVVTAQALTVAVLSLTALVALMAWFVVGLDQGLVSVLGRAVPVHEFFHDGRHLLGFPCH